MKRYIKSTTESIDIDSPKSYILDAEKRISILNKRMDMIQDTIGEIFNMLDDIEKLVYNDKYISYDNIKYEVKNVDDYDWYSNATTAEIEKCEDICTEYLTCIKQYEDIVDSISRLKGEAVIYAN